MKQTDLIERNRQLVADLRSGVPRKQVASKFGVSYSQTYRAEKSIQSIEQFQAPETGGLYTQIASTGLKRYGGNIDDDYNKVFRSLSSRIALYREMGDDPIVSATLQAIKMTLRRIVWHAEPQGEGKVDKEATEWLETCLNDMSQSWSDTVDQSLGMLQYGFQVGEIVYKKRDGYKSGDKPSSKYDDGKIGWRKMVFAAPESLAVGQAWVFDEFGGLQAWQQSAPPSYQLVTIPIDKSILFRTTTEKGSPEGRSILRAMYHPWYYKKNLEEIEGISAERMGAGLPVVYAHGLGGMGSGGDTLETLKSIVINTRADEQMGVLLPWQKMGSTPDGKGVLFELMSPPSRGIINFQETITRHEQRMTMVALAQFIHLGMNQVGARALAESSTDFFTLAVSAWAGAMADTFNRYAVERLFRLNNFPGLEQIPLLKHEPIGRLTLAEIAEYINKLVNAQVITPTPELESELLKLADLPEGTKPAPVVTAPVQEVPAEKPAVDEGGQAGDKTIEAPPETQNVTTTADVFVAPRADIRETGPKLDDLFSELRYAIRLAEKKDRPEAAPNITINNPPQTFNVATPAVTVGQPSVTVNVPAQPAPVVNVEPSPAPVVNVAPADVTVNVPEQGAPQVTVNVPPANPTPLQVNVAAPDVTVDNTVNLPHKTTEVTEVKRNAQGQIESMRRQTDYEAKKE